MKNSSILPVYSYNCAKSLDENLSNPDHYIVLRKGKTVFTGSKEACEAFLTPMKHKKSVMNLMSQGLSLKESKKLVRDIEDIGYSPFRTTNNYTAAHIKEIIESVERALARHFKKENASA